MALKTWKHDERHFKSTNSNVFNNLSHRWSSIISPTTDIVTRIRRTPMDTNLSDDDQDLNEPQRKRPKTSHATHSYKPPPMQLKTSQFLSNGLPEPSSLKSLLKVNSSLTHMGARDSPNGMLSRNESAIVLSKKRPISSPRPTNHQQRSNLPQHISHTAGNFSTVSPKHGNGTRNMPFLIDDSSTIEPPTSKVHHTLRVPETPSPHIGISSPRTPQSPREKEFQRLQSLRLRQEAENRRNNAERTLDPSKTSTSSTAETNTSQGIQNISCGKTECKPQYEANPKSVAAKSRRFDGLPARCLESENDDRSVLSLGSDTDSTRNDEITNFHNVTYERGLVSPKFVSLNKGVGAPFSAGIRNPRRNCWSVSASKFPDESTTSPPDNNKDHKPNDRPVNAVEAARKAPKPALTMLQALKEANFGRDKPGCSKPKNQLSLKTSGASHSEKTNGLTELRESRTNVPAPIPKHRPQLGFQREHSASLANASKKEPATPKPSGQMKSTQSVEVPDRMESVGENSNVSHSGGINTPPAIAKQPRSNSFDNDEKRRLRHIADLEREAESRRRNESKVAQEQQKYQEQERKREEERKRAIRQQEELKARKEAADAQRAALNILSAAPRARTPPETVDKDAKYSDSYTDSASHEPGSREAPAAIIAEAQKRREDRIKTKERVNERRRYAEALELELEQARKPIEDIDLRMNNTKPPCQSVLNQSQPSVTNIETPEDSQLTHQEQNEALESLPAQPVSLNSLAGQEALSKALQRSTLPPFKKINDRRPSEILPQDIKIVRWREQGMTYPVMATTFAQVFGLSRTAKSLQKRHKMVKAALDASGVSKDMLDLVEAGSDEAKRQLNTIIRQQFRNPAGKNLVATSGATQQSVQGPAEIQLLSPPLIEEVEVAATATDVFVPSSAPQETRPQVSGKTMNAAAFHHYLQVVAEERAEENSDEDCDSVSIISEDLCRFKYQVVRRELTSEDLENGESIEDRQFCLCGSPYDSITQANRKAASQIYRVGKGSPYIGTRKHSLFSDHDDDGLANLELTGDEWGLVQVRVVKYVQANSEGEFRCVPAELAPRKIYLVKECTFKRVESSDDLFGESDETFASQNTLDNTVFTALELANSRAIQHFVKLTFRSKSANLTIRKVEIQQKENEWTQWLQEQEEGTLFHATAELDEITSIEVLVEEGTLSGPRNI